MSRNQWVVCLFSAVIMFQGSLLLADTIHEGGTISTHQTWAAADGDHIVTGNITVAAGGSLTIEPGCIVKLGNYISISVQGTLTALGTPAEEILFTRRETDDQWYGLFYYSTSSGSLAYCTIEHATGYGQGYAVYGAGALPQIQHCTFRNNSYGVGAVNVTNPTLAVANTFTDNVMGGIYFNNCSGVSISNQTLTGHVGTYGAIYLTSCGSSHFGTGNAATGNSWALTMDMASYPDLGSAGNIPISGNTNDDGIQVLGSLAAGDMIWYDLDMDYILTGNTTIQGGASLSIEPGCVVKLENYISMTVFGTLNGLGTPADEVLFTRRDADDQWYGLFYYSGSSGNLAYCTIEHATGYGQGYAVYGTGALPQIQHCTFRNNSYGVGATNLSNPTLSEANTFTDNVQAGIYFNNCSGASISNQTLTGHVGSHGAIYITSSGSFHFGSGNVATGNSWALTMDLGSYPDLGSAGNIPIGGNTNDDGIQIVGSLVAGDMVWYDLGVDFIIAGNVTIQGGTSLSIDPGCVVKLENYISITLFGTLNAVGTPADEILFTRRHADDHWYGLFYYTGSSGNLTYCTLEYATGYGQGYAVYGNGSLPQIQHCTFRNNSYGVGAANIANPALSVTNTFTDNVLGGIYFNNCTDVSISNQTLTGHTGSHGAIYLTSCGSFHMGAGNTATGNSWALSMDLGSYPDLASAGNIPIAGNLNDDGIRVFGALSSGHMVWHDLNIDYILTGNTSIQSETSLTIEPGCVVKMGNNISMSIFGDLNAPGTPAEEVLFTRRESDGQWYGLYFYSGAAGSFDYCTLEYSTAYNAGSGVYLNNADIQLNNCTFHNNSYGLTAVNSSFTLINCHIVDNIQYGVYLDGECTPVFGSSLSQWNNIHSNGSGNPDRDLRNGTSNTFAPYVYWGTTNLPEIQTVIFHQPDDGSLGMVYFSPWTNEEHDETFDGDLSPVDDQAATLLPAAFRFPQNYPNPFNPVTKISYELPSECRVNITLYDVSGRLVETLVDRVESAGFKSAVWRAEGKSSGVYFCCIEADEFRQVRKIALVR